MARYLDGSRNRATPNSRKAASRSAERRRCPKCQRKAALVFISDEVQFGFACRWNECDYADMNQRSAVS